MTYANIELYNADDLAYVRKGIIGEDEVRQITVKAMADSGSVMLCINESLQKVLGLPFRKKKRSQLTNNTVVELDVVGPVIILYLDRECSTNAIVLPDDSEVLLGAIPMEEMDLYVHPSRNELLPVHPEGPIMSLK